MKKILASVSVLVAALVFSGCGAQKAAQQTEVQKEAPVEVKNETAGGVVNSIKDAVGLNAKMKCTTTANDGVVSTVYVQGKMFKSSVEVMKKRQNAIFDGEATYTWAEGEKTGLKMPMACIQELKASLPEQQKNSLDASIPDIEKEINANAKVNCAPAGDVDFSIPSDVVFADQCEVMRKSLNMMKDIKLPAGVQVPANMPKF